MDRGIMRECFDLPLDFCCDDCPYNIGDQGDYSPCGQQNCWYSCTVCVYNGLDNCGSDY